MSATNTRYYVSPAAIQIKENQEDSPRFLSVSIIARAVVQVYWPASLGGPADDGLNYAPDLQYLRFALDAESGGGIYLADDTAAYYLYLRLDPLSMSSLLVFSTNSNEPVIEYDEEDKVRYYWMPMADSNGNRSIVTAPSSPSSADRALQHFDTGMLSTRKEQNENSTGAFFSIDWANRIINMVSGWSFGTLIASALRFGQSGQSLSSVATSSSTASDSTTGSNSEIATTGFLFGSFLTWLRGKFVRKDSAETQVMQGGLQTPSVRFGQNGQPLSSVATSSTPSTDSTEGSNSQIATTGFLLGPFLSWLRGKFVRKDSSETQTMQGTLQAPSVQTDSIQHIGNDPIVIGTEQFVPSTQGSALFKDNGKEHLQIGNLTVLGRMNVKEVSIQEVNYIGGAQVLSGADGFTIKHVDTYVDGSKYRVWFDINDDTNHLASTWRAGDLAYSEKWNFRTGTSTGQVQRRWWRLVLSFGEQVPTTFDNDGSKMGYLILSASDCEPDSDTPTVGDKVVMLGHKPQTGEEADDYENRQNAILLFSTGTGAPYIRIYTGIDDYSLEDAICPIDLSPSNIQLLAEKIKIAGTSALGSNTTLASVIDNISHVNEQLDGSFQIWQGETTSAPLPNANYNSQNVQEWLQATPGEPASEWTTTKDKEEHLGDFYITSDGRCYMYATENDLFFWRMVEDQYLTAYVNEIGAKARVFTSSPIGTSLPYKQGDIWVNATYPTSGSITYNGDTYTPANPLFSNDIVVAWRDKTGALGSIGDWRLSNNYKEDVAAFAEQIERIAAEIGTQSDGMIESYIVATVAERNAISSSWTTGVGQLPASTIASQHLGDLTYVSANDTLYQWTRMHEPQDSAALDDGYVYEWSPSSDSITKQVIKQSKEANDLADGKRRVFVGGTPQPPYDPGDLWVNASASANNQVVFSNDIARCSTGKDANGTFELSDWALATGYSQSIKDLASDSVITDAEKEELKRFLMNATNENDDVNKRYNQYLSSSLYYDIHLAPSVPSRINLQQAFTNYRFAYDAVDETLSIVIDYSGAYRLDGQSGRITKASYDQLFSNYYTTKGAWDAAISKAILHYVKVYTIQGALLNTENGIEMVAQLLMNGAYAGVQSEIGALVEQGADGNWYSLARIKADKIDLEGYTTINHGFSIDENGNAAMQNATINGLLSRGAKYLTPLNVQSAISVVPTYLEATSGASLVNILELPLDRLGNYTYIYDGKDDVNNMWSGVGYPIGYDNYKTYKGVSATGYLISSAEEVIKKFLLESKSIDFDSQSSGYNMFVDAEIGTGHGCPTIVLPCFEMAAIYSSGTYQEWLGDAFGTYYETWCNMNNTEQQDDWTNDSAYMAYVWEQRGKRMYDARKWVGAEIDIYLIGACAIDVIGVYDRTEEVPANATEGFFETSLHDKYKYTYRFEVEPKNIGCEQGNCKKLHLKCYEESILVDTVDMGSTHENRYASVVRWDVEEEVVYNIDKYVMGLGDRE